MLARGALIDINTLRAQAIYPVLIVVIVALNWSPIERDFSDAIDSAGYEHELAFHPGGPSAGRDRAIASTMVFQSPTCCSSATEQGQFRLRCVTCGSESSGGPERDLSTEDMGEDRKNARMLA